MIFTNSLLLKFYSIYLWLITGIIIYHAKTQNRKGKKENIKHFLFFQPQNYPFIYL